MRGEREREKERARDHVSENSKIEGIGSFMPFPWVNFAASDSSLLLSACIRENSKT